MSRLTDSYLPAVTSITEIGTDYLYWADTVEKLCFEKSGDFICVLSVFPYSRYEGIVRNT